MVAFVNDANLLHISKSDVPCMLNKTLFLQKKAPCIEVGMTRT